MRRIIRSIIVLFVGGWLILTGVTAPVLASGRRVAAQSVTISSYYLAPFGGIRVYRPGGAPRANVIFLSGDGGWNGSIAAMAGRLAQRGILVAGISTPTFMRSLQRGHNRCINPNYPLVALSRDVQHRTGVRAYMQPVIMGYSAGATVAYASLSQWADGAYRGVISLGFSADIPGIKPWCRAPGFAARPIVTPSRGWLFAPNRRITVPWIVLQGARDTVVDFTTARRFAAAVPHARFIALPDADHASLNAPQMTPRLMATLAPMLNKAPSAVAGTGLPTDLPLTIVPPTGPARNDVMAVFYSGDGGWTGLVRDVAGQLAAKGVPVVGVDSLSYFWSQRTPAQAGQDMRRIITAYGTAWHRPRVMLIGYSFGADTLPAMVGTLDPATRAHIASLSLLGLSPTADFQFHLSSWLNLDSAQALPTIPAILRLRDMDIRCIQGAQESDSACPTIPNGVATTIMVPGGHHFARNAALLADLIARPATKTGARQIALAPRTGLTG